MLSEIRYVSYKRVETLFLKNENIFKNSMIEFPRNLTLPRDALC
ncbi:Uncharacterized protein dnm_025670 [Desulfonema magnum]|uniref:Uncharacterized protein n=1 Tax=Desulfonema magnum TaxID=45655 RepID=A0A975BJK4_9BACT|nr:Uncharacterized protein dnm_025670 [Desulfonema magnum]